VSEKQGVETVHASMDSGVNLFDTVYAYVVGQSEIFLGKALKGRRDKVYIASKAGHWGERLRGPTARGLPADIVAGGTLRIWLGPRPNTKRSSRPEDSPPSMRDEV